MVTFLSPITTGTGRENTQKTNGNMTEHCMLHNCDCNKPWYCVLQYYGLVKIPE